MISSNRTPKIHFTICVVLVVCSSLVSGCERQEERTKTTQPSVVRAVEASKPLLLVGDPGDSARTAVYNYIVDGPYLEAHISTLASGRRINRTDLGIAFTRSATIGEINRLIESIEGSIISMMEGADILGIQIPDPGDLESYEAILQQLEADPLVRGVIDGSLPDND